MTGRLRWAIAIPAHNEAERIGPCLAALQHQRAVMAGDGAIVVLANNCIDETASVAKEFRHPYPVHVVQHQFAANHGSAGAARRLAMDYARGLIRDDGILLTTDADAVADPDWVAAMLDCFTDPRIDLVAGRVSADWDELGQHPAAALEVGDLEWRYCTVLPLVEDALDPVPHNPAPRHAQECGANMAIRAPMFDAIGGLPKVAEGEDRALIQAVFKRDGGIRYANAPHVTASARVDGRAHSGMATALRERIEGTYLCDELVMHAAVLQRRLVLRREARIAHAQGHFEAWAARHGADCAQDAFFGRSWAAFLDLSPALAPQCVHPSELPGEIDQLQRLLLHPELCREA